MSLKRNLKVPLSMRKFPMYMINRGPTLVINSWHLPSICILQMINIHELMLFLECIHMHVCTHAWIATKYMHLVLNWITSCFAHVNTKGKFYFMIGWMQYFLCIWLHYYGHLMLFVHLTTTLALMLDLQLL